MGRLITILIVSAACALTYVKFFRADEPPPEPPAVAKETPVAKLSRVVDTQITQVFSALDGKAAPAPVHQLRQLRASLADARPKARDEQAMYRTAIELCDTLVDAMRERERCNLSLRDTRSKPYATWQTSERQAFFEGGIQRRWLENAASYHKRVDVLYKNLRDYERRLLPPPNPGPAGSESVSKAS